jgi:hypothetical protein
MSGRRLTSKERADATKEYLAQPHPPVELDRGMYLVCRCSEFDCLPHRAHFHELAEFERHSIRERRGTPPEPFPPARTEEGRTISKQGIRSGK